MRIIIYLSYDLYFLDLLDAPLLIIVTYKYKTKEMSCLPVIYYYFWLRHWLLHDLVDGGIINAYGGGSHEGYNTTTKLNFEQNQGPPQKKQLTRDFLGVGEIVRSMNGRFSTQREQQQQNNGLNNMMSSLLDPERNQIQQSFGSATND